MLDINDRQIHSTLFLKDIQKVFNLSRMWKEAWTANLFFDGKGEAG